MRMPRRVIVGVAGAGSVGGEGEAELGAEEREGEGEIFAFLDEGVEGLEGGEAVRAAEGVDEGEEGSGAGVGGEGFEVGEGDLAAGSGEEAEFFDFGLDAGGVTAEGFNEGAEFTDAEREATLAGEVAGERAGGFEAADEAG
jgi:hypothetical protein